MFFSSCPVSRGFLVLVVIIRIGTVGAADWSPEPPRKLGLT